MNTTQDAAASAPTDAVVGLIAVFSDGTELQFSGALISPTEVLTAAHGVYKQGVGQAIEVVALPGGVPQDLALAGSEAVFQTGTYAASVHTNAVPDADGTLTLSATQSDEALVGFGAPLTAGPVFAVAAGVDSAAVIVAGFPGSANGAESTASGTVTAVAGDTVYSGEIGLGPGSSGGPLYTLLSGVPTLIGTVSTSAYAAQVSPALLSTIRGWQAADAFAGLPGGGTTATAPGTAALLRLGDGTSVLDSGGNDTVQAGAGRSMVYAAGASCSVLGGSGSLVVVGGAGSDTVRPGTGTSLLYGGSGGGILDASTGGGSVLVAGSGNTTLVGGGSGDSLFCAATASGNVAAAGAGQEVIVAGQGAATILGGTGTATAFAGSGADTFQIWDGLGGTLQIVGFTAADQLDTATDNPVTARTSGAWGTTLSFSDGSHAVLFGVGGATA